MCEGLWRRLFGGIGAVRRGEGQDARTAGSHQPRQRRVGPLPVPVRGAVWATLLPPLTGMLEAARVIVAGAYATAKRLEQAGLALEIEPLVLALDRGVRLRVRSGC